MSRWFSEWFISTSRSSLRSSWLGLRRNPSIPDCLLDSLRRKRWILVFPNSQHYPTLPTKSAIRISITSSIRCNLLGPECAISLRSRSVCRASVPVTAIDENGYAGRTENDVGAASNARHDRSMESISEAETVELRPKFKLGLGVLLTRRSHALARGLGGRLRYATSLSVSLSAQSASPEPPRTKRGSAESLSEDVSGNQSWLAPRGSSVRTSRIGVSDHPR